MAANVAKICRSALAESRRHPERSAACLGRVEEVLCRAEEACVDYRFLSVADVAGCLDAFAALRVDPNGVYADAPQQLLQQAGAQSRQLSLRDLSPILNAIATDTPARHTRILSRAAHLLSTTPLHTHNIPLAIEVVSKLTRLRQPIPPQLWPPLCAFLSANGHGPITVKALRAAYEANSDAVVPLISLCGHRDLSDVVTGSLVWLLGALCKMVHPTAAVLRQRVSEVLLQRVANVGREVPAHKAMSWEQLLGVMGIRHAGEGSLHRAAEPVCLRLIKAAEVGEAVRCLYTLSRSRLGERLAVAVQRKVFATAGTLPAQQTYELLRGLRLAHVVHADNVRLFARLHRSCCTALSSPVTTPTLIVGIADEASLLPDSAAALRHIATAAVARMDLSQLYTLMRCYVRAQMRSPQDSVACLEAIKLQKTAPSSVADLSGIVMCMRQLNIVEEGRCGKAGTAVVNRLALEARLADKMDPQVYVRMLKLAVFVRRSCNLKGLLRSLPEHAKMMGPQQICSCVDTLANDPLGGLAEGQLDHRCHVEQLMDTLVTQLETPLPAEVHSRLLQNLARPSLAGVAYDAYSGYVAATARAA